MSSAASRLPAELVLACLEAADPKTRVRASHISRTWRHVALSYRHLWDELDCAEFRHERHEQSMFGQLQTMLLRSNPLPFQLRIPHRSTCGSQSEYVARVLAIEQLDVHRLTLYDGPLDVFFQLSRDAPPLPGLVSLNFLAEYAPDPERAPLVMTSQFFTRRFANLQHLQVRWLSFSRNDIPLLSLRHLSCSVTTELDYQRILENYPNLVDLQLNDAGQWTILPPVSPPRSLRRIVICPGDGRALDLPDLLQHWADLRVPRLVLPGALSLDGVLPLFVASDAHQVELRLTNAGEIELKSLPTDGTSSRTWAMTASHFCNWEFLDELETRSCTRLTSISVAIEQLRRLLAAHLDAPGLERLEFLLVGTQKEPLLQAGDDAFFLLAPRLKRVLFTADGNADTVRKHKNDIQCFLGVLFAPFRILIIYDAELLDTITLFVPAGCMLDFPCDGFPGLAKEYTICET